MKAARADVYNLSSDIQIACICNRGAATISDVHRMIVAQLTCIISSPTADLSILGQGASMIASRGDPNHGSADIDISGAADRGSGTVADIAHRPLAGRTKFSCAPASNGADAGEETRVFGSD
jgi:hypothetical protein